MARKDANHGSSKNFGIFDPAFEMRDLLVTFVAGWKPKIVTNSRSRNVKSQAKTLLFKSSQGVVCHRLREVIGGEFGSLKLHSGTVIDEVGQAEITVFVLQQVTIAVGCQAELEFGLPISLDWI